MKSFLRYIKNKFKKMESNTTLTKEIISDKIKGALLGQLIGDSLAMPVHWYYDINQLKKDFGKITKYEAPKETFPGSILNLSNTDGPGRGSDKGDLIGTVILHGKKKFWERGKSFHYHHGMKAGENTLDSLITRVLTRNIIKNKKFEKESFLEDYISFMTTPETHNDVYCSSSIRAFFKNYSLGKPLEQCPSNDNHNVDSIDNLVITIPVILSNINSDEKKRNQEIEQSILSTRYSPDTIPYAIIFSDLLIQTLNTGDLKSSLVSAGRKISYDVKNEVKNYYGKNDPMTACYIDSSFPVLLFYAYKYSENMEEMLLASANGGGENVSRGALLGALAGIHFGFSGIKKDFIDGLVEKKGILNEVDEFIKVYI